jgi:hypothetical protein
MFTLKLTVRLKICCYMHCEHTIFMYICDSGQPYARSKSDRCKNTAHEIVLITAHMDLGGETTLEPVIVT